MKKIRNTILIILVITAVAIAGFFAVRYFGNNDSEDVFATEKTYASAEEMYLDNLIDSVSPECCCLFKGSGFRQSRYKKI